MVVIGAHRRGWAAGRVRPTAARGEIGGGRHRALIGQNIAPPSGERYADQRIFKIAYQKRCGRLRPGETGYRSSGGWKIHIAADVDQANDIATRVLPVLCGLNVWHKYVPNMHDLYVMAGPQAYKFITIYPNPDNVDAPDGWKNVVARVAHALADIGVRPKVISDPRETKTNPDGGELPDFVSMRIVPDFTRP